MMLFFSMRVQERLDPNTMSDDFVFELLSEITSESAQALEVFSTLRDVAARHSQRICTLPFK